METIKFKTYVLGRKAAGRLKTKQVTQTLRGADFPKINHGDMVIISLDDELVGHAHISIQDMVRWDNLDLDDAKRGGFDNRLELGSALRRAGFRYRPIAYYEFKRIQFSWEDWSDAPVPSVPGKPSLQAEAKAEAGRDLV
jgi:hypothetical protein